MKTPTLLATTTLVAWTWTTSAATANGPTETIGNRLNRHKNRGKRHRPHDRALQAEEIDSYEGAFLDYDVLDLDLDLDQDLWEAAARSHYTKKSCRGKGSSCAPTTSPSTGPSPYPTISVAPSTVPSQPPSQRPSASPSVAPSLRPSVSRTPSLAPSAAPSFRPTMAPSDAPSPQPSVSPSTSPSQSLAPSEAPSATPSQYPSVVPTAYPTSSLFSTDDSEEGGLASACLVQPPNETQEQRLVFRYHLYTTPNAVADDQVAVMEERLHRGLARAFLQCNYPTDSPFDIVSVSAQPDDVVDKDTACNTSNDPPPPEGSICAVVTAEFTMRASFNVRRRRRRQLQTGATDASPEVLAATSEYLQDSMSNGDFVGDDVTQVTFQGFVNAQETGRETPPASETENGVAGAIGSVGNSSNVNDDHNFVLSGSVVALAALALLALLFVGGKRRKQRQDAYLKHLEDMSVSDLSHAEERPQGALADGRVHLVVDDDSYRLDDGDGDALDAMVWDLDAQAVQDQDVHQCSSATCPICRERERNPTFVAAHKSYAVEDLYRLPTLMAQRAQYGSPDTVRL